MVLSSWRPDAIEEIEKKWKDVKIPVNENISHSQAEQLMITLLEMRESWLDAYVSATYYEDVCNWKHECEYNIAFIQADAKSDKSRDIIAKSNGDVRLAKLNAIEAHAAVIKTKLKLESALLAHHAVKKIYEEASQERKWL